MKRGREKASAKDRGDPNDLAKCSVFGETQFAKRNEEESRGESNAPSSREKDRFNDFNSLLRVEGRDDGGGRVGRGHSSKEENKNEYNLRRSSRGRRRRRRNTIKTEAEE